METVEREWVAKKIENYAAISNIHSIEYDYEI